MSIYGQKVLFSCGVTAQKSALCCPWLPKQLTGRHDQFLAYLWEEETEKSVESSVGHILRVFSPKGVTVLRNLLPPALGGVVLSH